MEIKKKKKKIAESDMQKLISDWLSLNRIIHWRQNSGVLIDYYTDKQGIKKKRFIRFISILYPKISKDIFGKNLGYSFSDLAGIYKGTFFAIEVKKEGEKPTANQKRFIDLINENNGFGIIAYTVNDVTLKFKERFPDVNFYE